MASTNATHVDDPGLYRPRKFNSTTRQRFLRDRRARLLDHLRGVASYPQLMLIERIGAVEWEIARRVAQPDRSEHASRELMAQHNHLRLMLRELGLQPRPAPMPTLAEILAADRGAAA
jgi:hypothetical protein